MGKAARHKAQRRDGRAWSTIDPRTGQSQTFVTRLSNKALAEWEAERAELVASGYPDRPPDIDTARIRGWTDLPADRSDELPADRSDEPPVITLGCDRTARALGGWATRGRDLILKANLGHRPDGHLVVEFVVGSSLDPLRMVATKFQSSAEVATVVREFAQVLGLPEPTFTSAEQVLADLSFASADSLAAA